MAKVLTGSKAIHPVSWYADELVREREQTPKDRQAPDTSARTAATMASMKQHLGIYRDPWFGEVSICESDEAVTFSSRKSPQLTGKVMQVGDRMLIDWNQDDVDAEAWLTFDDSKNDKQSLLTLSKVDPDADFSFDYEDLAFA